MVWTSIVVNYRLKQRRGWSSVGRSTCYIIALSAFSWSLFEVQFTFLDNDCLCGPLLKSSENSDQGWHSVLWGRSAFQSVPESLLLVLQQFLTVDSIIWQVSRIFMMMPPDFCIIRAENKQARSLLFYVRNILKFIGTAPLASLG